MTNFVDLTGKQFGNWLVLKYLGKSKWLCECQCENKTHKEIHSYSLREGKSTSCGCIRKMNNTQSKLEDLTGKQFGDWLVLRYAGDSMWECECQCENKTRRLVKAQSLKSGKSKSCGHSTNKFKDLTNKVYNNWKVIKYAGNQKWTCECQCSKHTIKDIDTYNLINGLSKSCGCTKEISNKLIDLTNMQFGELTVIKYIGENKWLCQCSCGNKSIHYGHNLRRSNNTISCGCKEITPYTKQEIIYKINEYTNKTGNKPFSDDLCTILDRAYTSVRRYINKYNLEEYLNNTYKSKAEYELNQLYPTNYVNCRNIIDSELDLYYPDKNTAIEFNGSYWHSEIYKDKYYHQRKTIDCATKNIQLIHIFEYEWNDKDTKEKIKKILNNKLGITKPNKVYARNTYIKFIDKSEADNFLNTYHLQNTALAKYYLGCYSKSENELLGVITFGIPRFNKEYEYEIVRLCWKDNVHVIGGTEKLFKFFINNVEVSSIITYVDISKFTGNVYTKIGFKPTNKSITEPNYVWWSYRENIILSRYQTMKHKLIKQGLGEENQTEDEIMTSLGFYKIYNSGNLVLTWYKDNYI